MNFTPGAHDGYYLSRTRLSLMVRPTPWLKFFGEGQDGRVLGYNASTQPANMHNALDLRQGFIDLSTEDRHGFGLRIGRQELVLGSARLIGVSDWGLSRTFDGARASFYQTGLKIDVMAITPVLLDPSRVDRKRPGDRLAGSYITLDKWGPELVIEPYVFVRRQIRIACENGRIGDAMVGTAGFRVLGKLPGRIDYSAELARQWGSYAGDSISSMAGAYVAGWTVNGSPGKPRLSVEYDHASGDRASNDGHRQTFDQLYSHNPNSTAVANLMGWRNMRNPRAGFEFLMTKKWKVQADINEFYLATTQDSYYNAYGVRLALNRNATSRHVGSAIDVTNIFQLTKTVSVSAGIVHLFPGEYLKQSTPGSGYNYPYLAWTKRI